MNKQIVLMLVGLVCLTSIAYAQMSANYNLSWHVICGGGKRDSPSYSLRSTAGPIIGSSDSSKYRLGAGYWYGFVYTPTQDIKFDTGTGTYPSISGTHNGTITPKQTITVHKLYTYPCEGTGGHTEYAKICNEFWSIKTLPWTGYNGEWHKIFRSKNRFRCVQM